MNQKKDSLLTKYLEHFKIIIKGRKFYMVIMNNLFVGVQPRQYDLKGSTIGRETLQARINSGFCVFKDKNFINDFKDQIGLLNESHERISKLLKDDAKFLEELKVIDYSLLLGVVKRDDFASIKMIINDDSDGKKVLDISSSKEVNEAEEAEEAAETEKSQGDTGKKNLFVP